MKVKIYTLENVKNILNEKEVLTDNTLNANDLILPMENITFDSREVTNNTVFICKGKHFKPIYLENAIKKGAIAYISEIQYDVNIPGLIVKDIIAAMGILANIYYDEPWKKLNTFGVTGTKGKSTTVYYLKSIINDYMASLNENKCAFLSSINNYDGVTEEESHLTTPEALVLQKHFFNAVNNNIKYFLMEVSSQALKYNRTYGVIYDIGCFLNIGLDHISDIEHTDFNDYFLSKLKLLEKCKNIIINKDMDYFNTVFETAIKNNLKPITIGKDASCDFYCYDIKSDDFGINFKVKSSNYDTLFTTKLHGLFNVDNALAAIAAASLFKIPLQYIKSGLEKATVDGRMEIFQNEDKTKTIIVDYAHNKMSFNSLISSVKKEFPDKKITIVFGCPGIKAIGRRQELGELAGKFASKSYITEEDPGEEPIKKINEEIAKYIKKENGNYVIINDRTAAIQTAINEADENTIVLITGKGRETRQKRGTEYIQTISDVDVVCNLLNKEKIKITN